MRYLVVAATVMICAAFLLSSFVVTSTSFSQTSSLEFNKAVVPAASSSSLSGKRTTFAFVSNFETQTLEGWKPVSGVTPTVVTTVSYSGEPSLKSSGSGNDPQVNFANKGFVTGLSAISFQVAIHPSDSEASSYFGLSSGMRFVAVVGVDHGSIVAGRDLSSLQTIEPLPFNTAQPHGWVYLVANVYPNTSGRWVMQVFVDRTDIVALNSTVPGASDYSGVMMKTLSSTVYYSDIVVSSSLIASPVQNFNIQEGYGEGGSCLCSSLNVKLLPAFYNVSADMSLDGWSVPQNNILSFQINSSNKTGTIVPLTCVGFFQLGVDFDQSGHIAPWYVKGNNCVAHYFAGLGGIISPQHSNLTLSIVIDSKDKQIDFKIVDYSIDRTFSSAIPYYGGAFESVFTQLEFQFGFNTSSISDYRMQGSLSHFQITTNSGIAKSLNSVYMLPFSILAPPSWDFTYFNNNFDGYTQKSQ